MHTFISHLNGLFMKRLFFFLYLLVVLGCLGPSVFAQTESRKKINLLYLNSYENGYGWSDTILEGIKSVIAGSGRDIHLDIEYMDTKIRYDQKVKMHLFGLYAHKYRNVEFDVIIVSDNNGFDFLLQFQGELFPSVPVIFCGVNDFSPHSIRGYHSITGVVESFDIKINLELARKFHPDRKKFVIVGDNGTTGKAIRSQILKTFDKMTDRPPFEIMYLVIGNQESAAKAIQNEVLNAFEKMTVRPSFEIRIGSTLEQLTHDAESVAKDAFFYFIPFYMDHQRGRYTANDIVQTLWEVTQAPIYSNWKFLVGSGVVGGKMIDGFEHGKAAAQMAMRVLDGESAVNIPIVKPNDEAYLFDNTILEKLKISRDDLPDNSQLINQTSYFIEIHRQVFWVLVGGAVLVTITLIFLTVNISQRKLAQSKLKDQLTFVRQLMNTIPIPIYFCNADGRLTGVNRAFEEWFDLDREQILGHEPHLQKASGLEQLTDDIDDDLLNDPGIRIYEKRIQLKGGRPKDVILHKACYTNTKDQIVGIVGAIHDISKRKMFENKLVESTKMEAIGTLSGGIAHDFNNILTSIINSTELAMEDLSSDCLAAKDLRRSLKAARRGSRLVKQILSFSRADKEGFKPIQVSEVVQEAIALIEASLPRNIQFKTHIATKRALCMADPTQIHQIVMNLCTNAFQSLRDQGGTLAVTLKQTEIDRGISEVLDIKPGAYLKLSISDNGPGIADDVQDRIFDPFFTTKAKGEGTGLGLAVVHGIVKGHNGAIRLSSIPHKSTTFEIYLPLLKTTAMPASSQKAAACKGQESILFVEDDEDQLVLIPRVLSQLGYSVIALPTGWEAYAHVLADNQPIDLIITDYDMPEMNGLQLAQQIETVNPTIPIIIVTGRKKPEGMDTAAANIKKLISKPYNKTTISEAIREVLEP